MKRYPLPKEYVKELNEHKYVEKATDWTVSFTTEFQQLAYEEFYRGKSTREVFTEAGFDVNILGDKRLQNFKVKLMAKAERESGFTDLRKERDRNQEPTNESKMLKRIRELEHRNAYLEQENEFLKKIQELEKGYGGKAVKHK